MSDFGPGRRENLRCIGGPWDGERGCRPDMPPFIDWLWIGPCTIPRCPCNGKALSSATHQPREDFVLYRFDGDEECMAGAETWRVGIYVCGTITEEARLSEQEIKVEETAVTAFRRALNAKAM